MEEQDIEKLEQEREEYLNGWKRAKADLINYKKEEGERMKSMVEYSERRLLMKIFPVLDSLERAAKLIPKDEQENQIYKGFLQIVSQWKEFLKKEGVNEIEAVGKQFDPELHEAVGEADSSNGEESGMVAEELEKGYIKNNTLLRPARVKIIK
jgi:molecular chaperone GrpE